MYMNPGVYSISSKLEDVMEIFSEEPLVVVDERKKRHSKRKASAGDIIDDEGGSSIMRIVTNDSAAAKWATERDRNVDKKNEIKSSHERHHNDLVSDWVYCDHRKSTCNIAISLFIRWMTWRLRCNRKKQKCSKGLYDWVAQVIDV